MRQAQAADAGAGRVFVSRHPAERLTAVRVRWRDEEGAHAVMPTPAGVPTTIGHYGMLADVTCAQSVVAGLPPRRSIRTINLQVHLIRPVRPGTLLHAHGRRMLLDDSTALSQVQIQVEGGQPVAAATARFLVLDEPHDHAVLDEVENQDALVPAPTWDHALNVTVDGPDTILARPTAATGNSVGTLHGGMHVRLLDLAVRHWLRDQTLPHARLTDLAVSYHRAGPTDGRTRVWARVEQIRRGRRTASLRLVVQDREGRILSGAEGTLLLGAATPPQP